MRHSVVYLLLVVAVVMYHAMHQSAGRLAGRWCALGGMRRQCSSEDLVSNPDRLAHARGLEKLAESCEEPQLCPLLGASSASMVKWMIEWTNDLLVIMTCLSIGLWVP